MATISHQSTSSLSSSRYTPPRFAPTTAERSPPSSLSPPHRFPASMPRLPSDPSSAHGYMSPRATVLTWLPLTPPDSVARLPTPLTLLDQVRLVLCPDAPSSPFAASHEFTGVSQSAFKQLECALLALQNTLIDFPKAFRVNYLGERSVLIITVPGKHHEAVAVKSQLVIRQTLYDQGFYWPAWGNDIDHIMFTGTANQRAGDGSKQSSIQPDGSLEINGQKMPFMIIEVADTETYQHARTKTRHMLHCAKGQIRFAIIINLIRGSTISTSQRDSSSSDRSLPGSPTRVSESPVSSKRPANDSDSFASKIKSNKKARGESGNSLSPSTPGHVSDTASSSEPTSSTESSSSIDPAIPPPFVPPYSAATVTVLASKLIASPTSSGGKRRVVVSPIDGVECWPSIPGPESEFKFTWADMGVKEYPAELRDQTFTISWGWLNSLMTRLCTAPTHVPMLDDDEEASSESTEVVTSEEESESDVVPECESDGSWTA